MADYNQLMNLEKKQKATPPSPNALEFSSPSTSHQESKQESMLVSSQASSHASKHASMIATPSEIIESIRKIVKTPAKEEVLYVRLTEQEKTQLTDIAYTYQRQKIKTSENELGRIAVNFLIADFKANGENSVLVKVLALLNAWLQASMLAS